MRAILGPATCYCPNCNIRYTVVSENGVRQYECSECGKTVII